MAAEFLDVDREGLELLAELYQRFWTASDRGESLAKIATEIRQQRQTFGLTPMDRRRLQWEVERGESAAEKTSHRQTRQKARPTKDPRLKLVG